MPEGDEKPGKGFDDLLRDLEDNIFGVGGADEEPEPSGKPADQPHEPQRRSTLPTLVDKETANKILVDFMRKDKNQRKYDTMGMELIFKPYWFFTYTCELIMRDKDKNIIDSQEIGGRVAMDATTGMVADYLSDLLENEPIDIVDLTDELAQTGGTSKILEPKIGATHVEAFVKQKIAGFLRAEKENVSVAGCELLWSPVYKYWMTIKKRTHNLQIDGCGGYPINYDDIPVKEKTFGDRLNDDIELLKDPKKWREFLNNKGKAMRGAVSGKKGKEGGASGGKGGKGRNNAAGVEILISLIILIMFLAGLANGDMVLLLVALLAAGLLFWYMNHHREKPFVPLPPPPGYDYMYGGAPPPG